jgi:TAT (twin-arginine translocation) pathway signal sequence
MANDKHEPIGQTTDINRRDVLVGGAVAAAATALPARAAELYPEIDMHILGAIYQNPTYNTTFATAYSPASIGSVHTNILAMFPNRNSLTWGAYQQQIVADPANWGSPAAFNKWPDYVAETRNDLEKQPAQFQDATNVMDPFNPSKVAAHLRDHLDEVIRIALWDHAVPISINVGSERRRHHGLTTVWTPTPPLGATPPTNLEININCPNGGWQGSAVWRNPPGGKKITKFVASWKVPPVPQRSHDKQIIFIFNGLESVSALNSVGGILQPVLQWTKDGWMVRNWYMRADFDPVAYPLLPDPGGSASKYDVPGFQNGQPQDNRTFSKGVFVNVNQTIKGTVTYIGEDPVSPLPKYQCSFTVDNANDPTTDLITPGIPELISAVYALESYDINPPINRGAYYPAGSVAMSTIALETEQGAVNPVNWSFNTPNLGADYTTAASGAAVTFTLA